VNRLLIGLALLGVGCGSIGLDDYYAASVKNQCEFVVKCCGSMQDGTTYASVDDCVAKTTDAAALASVKAQITAGTLKYDGSAASSCIDTSRSLLSSCSNTISLSKEESVGTECNKVLVGAKKIGEACDPTTGDSGCNATEAYCASTGGTSGACAPLAKAGTDCTTAICDSNLYCDATTTKCTDLKAKGATCDTDDECSTLDCNTTCITPPAEPVTDICDTTTTN
jgi:hypothetical protein